MDLKEFMEAFIEEIGKSIPEDVKKDLREKVETQVRIEKRIKNDGMIPIADVIRYNELCYKHFREIQDVPPSLCGVYDDDAINACTAEPENLAVKADSEVSDG